MAVDGTTQAALEAQVLRWRVLCYADFDGDVLRATSGLYDRTISGSGDSELDGTYESYSHNVIDVSPVKHNESGSDTVTISLGGLIVNNAAFLTLIGDRTNWQGRIARMWFYCVDANETQVGSIIPYYTGYMNSIGISGSPENQTVGLTVENYLASIAGASGKTYLIQSRFDSGDLSAAAAIAAANGAEGAGLQPSQPTSPNAIPDGGGNRWF
jgi:hypothetical protein